MGRGGGERLLRLDIDDSRHKRLKPEMLHITRAECRHHLISVVRCHIDQEMWKQKHRACHLAKKDKVLLDDAGFRQHPK
jgi:hypothetical protein